MSKSRRITKVIVPNLVPIHQVDEMFQWKIESTDLLLALEEKSGDTQSH